MHWLDVTLLVVLALGALLGARRGLLWQVARLVTFGLALYVCIYYHDHAVALLSPYLLENTSALIVSVLAYGLTFLAVYLVGYGITVLIEKGVKAAKLKFTDRVLGAAFGLAKAGLVAGAILLAVAVVADPLADQTLAESKVAPYLMQSVRAVLIAVPQEYKDEFNTALERVRKAGEEKAAEVGAAAARNAVEEQLRGTAPSEKR